MDRRPPLQSSLRPTPNPHIGGWEGSLRGERGNCFPPALPSKTFLESSFLILLAAFHQMPGHFRVAAEMEMHVAGQDIF